MTVTASTSGSTPATPATPDLVNLTIDGVGVSVPKGTLLIRAAERIGIQIPRFCDHPLLEPVGACRQCLVEVATPGPDGSLRPMPKPMTSCTTTASEGMVVKSQQTSPMAQKAQAGQMEFLLINHPLDCPVCDKGGDVPPAEPGHEQRKDGEPLRGRQADLPQAGAALHAGAAGS